LNLNPKLNPLRPQKRIDWLVRFWL